MYKERFGLILAPNSYFRIALLILIVFLCPAVATPQNQNCPSPAEEPIHFILLFDDSDSMKTKLGQQLVRELTSALYEGKEDFVRPINSKIDKLSIVFFALHKYSLDSDCKRNVGLELDTDHLFHLQAENQLTPTKEEFKKMITDLVEEGKCRFRGSWSPITTAETLVISYVQKNDQFDDKLFSKVIIINVTDNESNFNSSPTQEINDFRRKNINVEKAEEEIKQVLKHFSFNPDSISLGKLSIRFLQVKPKEVFPDSFLSHNVAVKLSRLATSNKTLNVVPFNSEASKLKIQKIDSDNNNKFSNKPKLDVVGVHINYKSKDKSNKPWIIDKIELPNSVCITKELNKLHTSNDRYISVDLWRQPVVLTSNESAIAPGEVVFKVRFHATSTVYNNLYVDSSERSISFSAVDPEIMPDLTGNRALSNNEILTLWNPQDNSSPNKGLMANIALERNINQRENRMLYTTLVFIIALVASILVILYYFYITAYHRIFGIKLDWDGSSDIVIDFDNLVPSHLLIGKIQITNPNPLPWFGKLLKNSSYPREETEIALSYTNLSEYGFSIKDKELPIGFLPKSSSLQESEKTDTSKKVILTDKITKHVAHQDDVNIFFATETIEDIFSISRVRELQEEITLNISVSWITLGQKNIVEKSWSFNLKAIPERATPPKADFIPANKGDFYFEKDKRIKLGYYDFTSRARHAFAEAFSDTYSLKAFRDGQPLKEGLLYLDPHSKEDITIPSMVGKSEKNNISIPVFLYCDGITVVNPTSDSHIYEFVLVGGDLAPESKSKKEQIKLFRDPKRSEIELKVFYRSSERFIYWEMDNIVKQKNISSREILDPNIKNNCVEFSAYKASIADKILNLVSLEIGNSAKSGDGRVEVTASPIFINNDPTLIKTRNTASLEKSLLSVYQKNKLQNSPIVVKEGEKSVKVDIRLNPSFIEKIEGTVISADKCRAEIKLFIAIYSHEGHKTADRELLLKIPLHLEQLPGSNWLCIDFGTSSIAAAFGIEGKEEGKIIDLQNIVVDKYGLNISYKEFDPINSERSTKFLPSWIICDADERDQDPKPNDYKSRPAGFPRFQPAKLIPCDPSFIGLPAPQADINDSERLRKVVLSLKSWLGQSARFVKLQKEIGLQEDGQFVQKSSIPLDDLMESAFAALAEAYLIPHLEDNKLEVHQIVLCHPNTFTQVHKERLQNIAYRALSDRLKIDNPKHIHLISESDAVAYSYCLQKKKEGKNEGTERIMIYDFGAGTLDISVIKFKWNKNANYPEKWITESRIGVPVAGNYLDKMLACLIDSSLKKLLADTQYQDKFDYQYPVVAETLKPEKTNEHRRAIQELWAAIKEAKQVWKQGQPFIVKVGEEQSLIGILKVKDIKGGYPTERPEINKLGLWGDGTYLRLAIPPSIVNEDKNFKEFIKFITHTVPAEAIKIAKNTARKAGGSKQNVETDSLQWKLDKIVLSGRGALWPGLQGYLEEEFDISATLIIGDKSLLNENEASNGMKEAVARGAIAWPTVEKDIEKLDLASPQLAVLIANKTNIVFIGEGSEKVKGTEKNNGKGVEYEPIDLKGSPNFNLVQVAVADPNPREDINDKFRRYFYIELSDHHYKRDIYWKEDPRLYIEQKEEDGHKEILLKNYDGYTISAFSSDFRAEQPTDEPSWPIGSPVINPNGQ